MALIKNRLSLIVPAKLRLIALLMVSISIDASAQAQRAAVPALRDVSEIVQSGLEELNIPGAAAAVVADGQIGFVSGFGQVDDSGSPVTAQTPFQIASITKSFTALIILQLADEGRLRLDDPVTEFLPHFRMSDPDHYSRVTLRHLMNHTSGFATYDGNRLHGSESDDPNASESAVRLLNDSHPVANPGEQFHYSNANYIVLGHLIEEIEQMPYEDVLAARVFSRLGMVNSYGHLPKDQTASEAKGHDLWFGFARQNHRRPDRATLAAGGITASAEDLAKYLRALSQRDKRIVPPTLSHKWDDAEFTGYAFGWHHVIVDGRRAIFHDGFSPGFRSLAIVMPDEGRAALMLVNASGTLDGQLTVSAVHHALGLHEVPIQSQGMSIGIWASLAGTLCFVLGCFHTLRKAYRLRHTPWKHARVLQWALTVLPSIALAGGAVALLVLVPRSMGLDLMGTWVFFPDLTAMLLTMTVTAVAWATILPGLVVSRPRA